MIGLSQAQFTEAFPFHLALGESLEILQCGRSFQKLCGFDPVGSNFLDLFNVRHPANIETTQRGFLENDGLLFILDLKARDLPVRGEFKPADMEGVILFLGSPWLADQPKLSTLGLSLNDFALHDSLTDLMHLIQTQQTSLEESAELARKLKYQQEALAEAHRQAESANRAKSLFLANMSHELRTPLNSVLGFAQLMAADSEATARQRERLGIIQKSGEHLLDLLNDLLDMSKIEAGTASPMLAPFTTRTLLSGIEDMFRQRADSKDLRYKVSIAPDVPKTVVSDLRKIRQTLLNLVGNALKFTASGSVTLHASWDAAGFLEFEVRDTGPGITPEKREAIFNPFERGDQEGGHAEGAGLGLAICKRFVELLGGRIGVESRLGSGSTFTVSIPAKAEAGVEVEVGDDGSAETVPEPEGWGGDRYQIVGDPPRVLVVDDDPGSREALVAMLLHTGIVVTSGSDGRDAVKLAASWHPDLIFMDIRMPVINGAEACKIIKQAGPGAPKVIFLTASFYEKRDFLRKDLSDGWLTKPFRFSEVIGALETHLGVRFEREAGDSDVRPGSDEGSTAPIPEGVLRSLAEACATLEFSSVQECLKEIQKSDPECYGRFAELAGDFRYAELEQIVRRRLDAPDPPALFAGDPVQPEESPMRTPVHPQK